MSKEQILQNLRQFLKQEKNFRSHFPVEFHFSVKNEAKLLLNEVPAIQIKTEVPSSLKRSPSPQKQKEEKSEESSFKHETNPKGMNHEQKEAFFALMKNVAPHLTLHETPLEDLLAHEKKRAWKWFLELPEIALIFPIGRGAEDLFLSQVAKAIHSRFGTSRVLDIQKIEKSGKADMLFHAKKLTSILSTKAALQSAPSLIKRMKEFPQTGEVSLEGIPVILIENPSEYLKNPQKKKLLWDMLCQHFDKK